MVEILFQIIVNIDSYCLKFSISLCNTNSRESIDFQIYIFTTSRNETVWRKWAASARECRGILLNRLKSVFSTNPLDELQTTTTLYTYTRRQENDLINIAHWSDNSQMLLNWMSDALCTQYWWTRYTCFAWNREMYVLN